MCPVGTGTGIPFRSYFKGQDELRDWSQRTEACGTDTVKVTCLLWGKILELLQRQQLETVPEKPSADLSETTSIISSGESQPTAIKMNSVGSAPLSIPITKQMGFNQTNLQIQEIQAKDVIQLPKGWTNLAVHFWDLYMLPPVDDFFLPYTCVSSSPWFY